MSTHHLTFTKQIAAAPEFIFELVADMPNYSRWLPNSSSFGGTVNVTPYPVRLGTTYLDAGPVEKPGVVTEFDPPRHIAFRHTVQIRSGPLNTDVDAQIRYTLDARTEGCLLCASSISPSNSAACSSWCGPTFCGLSAKKTCARSPS